MKLIHIYSISILWGSAFAVWSPFNHEYSKPQHAVNHYDASSLSSDANGVSAALVRAIAELQLLEKKSFCHQTARRLYGSNCGLFDSSGVQGEVTLVADAGNRLQDYIDSFSASLAICDLEAARATIPEDCEKFRESTLSGLIAARKLQGLHVSREEIRQCMKGLHSEQNSWTSFNSNKERANLVCSLSRHDIDKDNLVSAVQSILNVLHESELSEERRKESRVEEELATSKHFQSVRQHLVHVKDEIFGMWDRLSSDSAHTINYLIDAMKSASGNLEATNGAMRAILKVMMEGNAEHALAQQQAIVATSDLAILSQNAVVDFRQLMSEVGYNLTAMGIALAAMEQRHTEVLNEHRSQVQDLMTDVQKELRHTKEIISEVKDSAEMTAQWISNWALSMLPDGPGGISWPLFFLIPMMTVILLGHGIPASYTRNAGLTLTGLLIAKLLTMTLNGQLHTDSLSPSSLTQLARIHLSSIITDKSNFEPTPSSLVYEGS